MLLSVDYLVRWLDRAFWRKSNLTGMAPYPNFFSCTDLCSSLNRMGWWQTLPRFPTWTPRCQMICLTPSKTKFKSSHILWKILLWVNTVHWGSSATHVFCWAHTVHEAFLFADTEDRAHANQIKSRINCWSSLTPSPLILQISPPPLRNLQICPICDFLCDYQNFCRFDLQNFCRLDLPNFCRFYVQDFCRFM